MTSSEIKVKTNNKDQLQKTFKKREKLSRPQSDMGSFVVTPSKNRANEHLNLPLTLEYKRECYNNYV